MNSLNGGTAQIAERLIVYLRNELNDSTIEYDVSLEQLHGGFETHIYQFQLKSSPKELNTPLVLRLYPEFRDPLNAVWENNIQNVLANEGYPVPRAYIICKDKSILGGAFFIMDFLPGEPTLTPIEVVPEMLGKTHAALHKINPKGLIKSLNDQGIDENQYRLSNHYNNLQTIAKELPWIRDIADWLIEKRPPEPDRLAICHRDFHPLNILIQDGNVTGVLDWGQFLIADPTLDIASTLILLTINAKHLASAVLGPDFESVDWEMISMRYLDAYRTQFPLDTTHMDYYKVGKSFGTLLDGLWGQESLRHPLIVKDLTDYIRNVTGILITMPA